MELVLSGLSAKLLGKVFEENIKTLPDVALREELVSNTGDYVRVLSR